MANGTGSPSGASARRRAIERLKAEISARSSNTGRDADAEVHATQLLDPRPTHRADDLEAQARYHRERLSLYRAKVHGSTPTSPERLRELERASQDADRRLKHFRLSAAPPDGGRSKASKKGR